MKNCKYCSAELEEGNTICPGCGKDNAQVEQEETLNDAPQSVQEPVQESAEEAVQETSVETTEEAEQETTEETVAEAGEDSGETQAAPKGRSARKLVISIVAVVLLVALLAGLVLGGSGILKRPEETQQTDASQATEETVAATVPEDGDPDNETCKGTYTAEDDQVIAAADTVVAVAGDYELTNDQLQIYYWLEVQNWLSSYGTYAPYFGLDYTQPLDTQVCPLMEGRTWQQYFLLTAVHAWQRYQALAAEADANGYQLDGDTADYLAKLPQTMEEEAVAAGFEDAAALMKYNVGAGADIDDYVKFMDVYYRGYGYYKQTSEGFTATDEEIEAMFAAHEEDYAAQGLTKDTRTVDVRHILIMPEGATSETIRSEEFSEEAWAAAEDKAQEILNLWLAGEKTEDSFGELAIAHSQDGDPSNGGLYTGVEEGQMVEAFINWCFDLNRQVGDYDIVKTEFGYHIMYFSGYETLWQAACESDVYNEKANNFIDSCTDKLPMTVDYSKILLGLVDLGA